MALHEKANIQDSINDDVYASSDLSVVMPKYKFPKNEHDPRHAYQVVHDELMLDGNARQNLATFCQTWVDEYVHKLMDECIDKNMIDKDEYPQTAEIESRCIHMLADLWNSPDAANTMGTSTTGSSDAAMLGGMAMKWRWREKMKAAGKPTDKPNMICGPVQICWHKFARYWDVELREIPMERDRLIMTPEEVIKRCDENTIGVVPTLGVTFTCQYEPVKAVSDALDQLQKDTGLDIPLHVDGASGGFLAPFVEPELEWDFRLPRVKSINASGHKFGLAPLGAGWVVFRDKEDLPDDLIFWVNYLGGNMADLCTELFTPRRADHRPVLQLFYAWAGRDTARSIKPATRRPSISADEIKKLGLFEGHLRWPRRYSGHELGPERRCLIPGFNLFDLSDRIRMRGWQIAAYSMPPNRQDLVVMRILVRHGFSRDLADLLVNDLKRCMDYFEKNPVNHKAIEAESGGYKHS
jgi:glutamate decarboxylase